jgi:CubicO group peptidase (beta-lactamase class C family)
MILIFICPHLNTIVLLIFTKKKNLKLVKADAQIQSNGLFITDYPKSDGTFFSGGGGLSSTTLDYAIFLQMILNGGEYNGKRFLARNTVRMMTMNQIGDIDRGEINLV